MLRDHLSEEATFLGGPLSGADYLLFIELFQTDFHHWLEKNVHMDENSAIGAIPLSIFIDRRVIDRRGYSSVNIVIGVVAVVFFSTSTIDTRYSKI